MTGPLEEEIIKLDSDDKQNRLNCNRGKKQRGHVADSKPPTGSVVPGVRPGGRRAGRTRNQCPHTRLRGNLSLRCIEQLGDQHQDAGVQLDLQLRSTTRANVSDTHVSYDLDVRTYEYLRAFSTRPTNSCGAGLAGR